jgi:hypothetical protein
VTGKVHPEFARTLGTDRTRCALDLERDRQTLHEGLDAVTVQIFDHAVVVQDPHLIVREDHREHEVVGLRAGMTRVRGAAHGGDARGRGAAVVAVGDIECVQALEGGGQLGDRASSMIGQSS